MVSFNSLANGDLPGKTIRLALSIVQLYIWHIQPTAPILCLKLSHGRSCNLFIFSMKGQICFGPLHHSKDTPLHLRCQDV